LKYFDYIDESSNTYVIFDIQSRILSKPLLSPLPHTFQTF
jgi:hypothetical protein